VVAGRKGSSGQTEDAGGIFRWLAMDDEEDGNDMDSEQSDEGEI